MTPARLHLLLLVLSLVASAAQAAPVRVALRERALVERLEVVLGDIAEVTCADPAQQRRLAALPLGIVPASGRAVPLGRGRIARWMAASAGVPMRDVEWSGAETSEVRLAVRELPGASLAEEVTRSVREAFARSGKRAEVTVVRAPPTTGLPPGRMAFTLRDLPTSAALARRLTAWADVSVEGRFVRTVPVALDLRVFAPAVVALRARAGGEELQSTDVDVREVVWTGRAALPLTAPPSGHVRLRRPVAAGEPLTPAHLERAPEVSRGQWATLRSYNGGVELEARAEVLEDGFPGQPVRVRLPNASGDVVATVSGPGAVEVRP